MFTILMHYAEVSTYLDCVKIAVDAQRSALGFWPPAAYEQAAFQERLWVMVDEKRKYLGHILFGAARPSIRVFQISVEADARGHGVASELISALETFGERNGYMSILARVAAELPSNHFWDRSGYLVLRQIPGIGSRQRTINVRGKQLRIASLFEDGLLTPPSQAIRYSERPLVAELNYVLDLNVVFDLKKHREREYAARRVIKLALSGPYRLFIAREAVTELERTSIDPSSDSVLSFTRDLPCLPDVPPREISGVLAELTEVLHPGKKFVQLNPNDRSDVLHLGQSIHHRVRGFITSDGLMLRAQQTIHQRFGIEVISPFDLAFEPGALSTYSASVEAGTLHITELSELDRRKVEEFFTSIGVPDRKSVV
jgi:GNAT superfamily N-acetyltransferase